MECYNHHKNFYLHYNKHLGLTSYLLSPKYIPQYRINLHHKYFLNDNQWGERETVPANCAVYWGSDRGFDIPLNSKGETFAFVWSSCEEIKPVSASVPVRLSNEPLLEIYPNPVLNDQLNLSFKVADEVNIFILDLTGRVLYRTDMNSSVAGRHTIDLHSFKEGACLIRVFFRNHNRYESKMIVIFN